MSSIGIMLNLTPVRQIWDASVNKSDAACTLHKSCRTSTSGPCFYAEATNATACREGRTGDAAARVDLRMRSGVVAGTTTGVKQKPSQPPTAAGVKPPQAPAAAGVKRPQAPAAAGVKPPHAPPAVSMAPAQSPVDLCEYK